MHVREVHVIPVPGCMTPEESFAEIKALGYLIEQRSWWRRLRCRLAHGRGQWAVFEVDE